MRRCLRGLAFLLRRNAASAFAVVLVLVLTGLAAFGQAQTPPQKVKNSTHTKARKSTTPAQTAVAPAAAGQRIFIDPATGKIKQPEPEDIRALDAAGAIRTRAALAEPRTMQHPSGAVGVALDESYMSYSVATKNPDGTVSLSCEQGKKAAEKAVKKGGQPKGGQVR